MHSLTGLTETIRTHLVKADQIDLPTDVDPLWADAEYADVFEASLSIHNASCHGGWKCWWHSDSDDVQRLYDDGLSWYLEKPEKEGFETLANRKITLSLTATVVKPEEIQSSFFLS